MMLFSSRIPEVVKVLPVASPVDDFRQPRYSSNGNLAVSTKKSLGKGRMSKRADQDHYETDYTTGGESCEELDEDWDRYRDSICRTQTVMGDQNHAGTSLLLAK